MLKELLEKLKGPKTEEGKRRQGRILGLIPSAFFLISAAVYGIMLIKPAGSAVGEHKILAEIMLTADIAAGIYVAKRTLSEAFEEEIPSATRHDEEKIIRMQQLFCRSIIISVFLTGASILTTSRMTYVLMALVPAAALASAFVCLKYFAFEVEDLAFPEIAILVMICIFLELLFLADIVPSAWANGMELAVIGLASFAVAHSYTFFRENCGIIEIVMAAVAVLILSHAIFIGVNYTIVPEERMLTFTVTDKYVETDDDGTETTTLYLTNVAEHYIDEPIDVHQDDYRNLNIGDTTELLERTSIFNVNAVLEPGRMEGGGLVEMTELMGSEKAADIATLVIALILGMIAAAITMMGLDMVFLFVAAFLGFGAMAIYCFVTGEPWWVWAGFGVLSGLAAFVLIWFLLLFSGSDEEDEEEDE